MCSCSEKGECLCRAREASLKKIRKLIGELSVELNPYNFESVKMQVVDELDRYDSYVKEGCSCE